VGRRRFTSSEAGAIRRLLREKGTADRDRQKAIRGNLRRKYGFYISDFSDEAAGFTASDFDDLVARGTIEIEESASFTGPMGTAISDEVAGEVLPDVLRPNLRIVFCGTAVGSTSAQTGEYYAGRGNRFWSVLAHVELTLRQFAPEEYTQLPDYGIGLTDLAKNVSGSDAIVGSHAFDTLELRRKVEEVAPRVLAFNGKRAAEAFYGRSVDYGLQPETVASAVVFVLPSTSGSARGFWDESYWREVADFIA
jgi:TDG/mug DNA glycosylase family protein